MDNVRSPITSVGVGIAGGGAILIGVTWLWFWFTGTAAGWAMEGALTVKTNMALGQVLAGAALLLLAPLVAGSWAKRVGLFAASIVLVIGALTLSEHLFGWDLGIDQLLVSEPPGGAATVSPNRMGPPGSLSLLLLGLGLLLLPWRQGRHAPWFGLATCLMSVVPAVGFLYQIPEFYNQPRLTGIAWATVVALIALGTGLMLARPAHGPLAQLLSDDPGGVLLRRLWPAVVVIPLLLGFLQMVGRNHNLFGRAAGTGMLVLALILVFSVLLWRSAAHLSRAARAQATAKAELRSVALFPEENPFPVLRARVDGTLLYANRAAKLLLEHWGCAVGQRVPDSVREVIARAVEAGKQEFEITVGERVIGLTATPIAEREYVNFYGVDMTERRRAEDQLEAQRQLLETVVNHLPAAVNIFRASDFTVLLVNPEYQKFAPGKAMIGRSLLQVWPEVPGLVEIFREVAETGIPYSAVDVPYHIRRAPDGPLEEAYFSWSLFRIPLPGREGWALLNTAWETTHRKKIEEALRESEERFRTMADGTPLPIWVTDAEGRNRFVNRAYCDFFGVNPEAVQDDNWQPLIHPQDGPDYIEGVAAALRQHRPFRAQARARRHDGAWRWIESYAEPRFSPGGEFLGMAGSSSDITERKEFQLELERLVAERTAKLQELVGELEHFSYTITHDMRAPLRAMMGFAEVVNELGPACPPEQQKDFLQRIVTSARRMDLLITDALNYSRAVRQQLPLGPVDVGALLRGMLDTYPELQPSKARIQIEGEIPLVLGNEAGLTQCFSNLLGNAVKFIEPGKQPEVRIWAEPRNGRVRIWVADNGIGITRHMLPRIFDMFSRGQAPQAGTGIGLALVRKVVTEMDGQVGAESEPGIGSRFWVELQPGDHRRVPSR